MCSTTVASLCPFLKSLVKMEVMSGEAIRLPRHNEASCREVLKGICSFRLARNSVTCVGNAVVFGYHF
jgi:hypothetical protein